MLLVERFAIGVGPGRIEVAEAPAERQQLWVRKALAVENDDQPLAPCVFDGVDVGLRDWLHRSTPLISAPNAASKLSMEMAIGILRILMLQEARRAPTAGSPPIPRRPHPPIYATISSAATDRRRTGRNGVWRQYQPRVAGPQPGLVSLHGPVKCVELRVLSV